MSANLNKDEILTISIDELFSDWLPAWSDMAKSCPQSAVFLDPLGISAVCKSKIIASLNATILLEKGNPTALALYSEDKHSIAGITLRTLQSINVDMFGRYEFLCDNLEEISISKLWEYLLSSGRWDAISFNLIPAESLTLDVARKVAHRLGWHVHAETQFSSPWKRLQDNASEWDVDLKSKFKSNLRNRERRIEKLGKIRFDVANKPGKTEDMLKFFYNLESAGWKGEGKTSIAQKPLVKSFYDHLVSDWEGTCEIAVLYLDDKPIASQLLRLIGDRMYVVKVGYDPKLRKYSPGQLIMCRTIQYAIGIGIKYLDFLGEEEAWKSDWNTIPSHNISLALFSPGIKTGFCFWYKYGVRTTIKKIPGAKNILNIVKRIGNGS